MSLRCLPLLACVLALSGVPPLEAAPKKKPRNALRTPPETPGFGAPAHGGAGGGWSTRADVAAWAEGLAAAQGFDAAELRTLLGRAAYQPRAAQLMMPAPAGVPKDWGAYRARFVEPQRLQAGLRFWAAHDEAFARAEATQGVPARLVAGIVGVETFYGQIMGSFRVLDVLATLAFDFPGARSDRTPFFREQLGEFLLLARAERRDPFSFKGSFAGAMGYGQFMPGSWRAHALDFDGDAHIDLIGNPVDAIGSVAHFLVNHGWRPGLATHRVVEVSEALAAQHAERLSATRDELALAWSPEVLRAAGLPESAWAGLGEGPFALMKLENGGAAPIWVLGTHNFWVLTRYNRSSYYALAVLDLAAELQRLRGLGG